MAVYRNTRVGLMSKSSQHEPAPQGSSHSGGKSRRCKLFPGWADAGAHGDSGLHASCWRAEFGRADPADLLCHQQKSESPPFAISALIYDDSSQDPQ